MPAKKTLGIKKAIVQYVNGERESISKYTIKSASGHADIYSCDSAKQKYKKIRYH